MQEQLTNLKDENYNQGLVLQGIDRKIADELGKLQARTSNTTSSVPKNFVSPDYIEIEIPVFIPELLPGAKCVSPFSSGNTLKSAFDIGFNPTVKIDNKVYNRCTVVIFASSKSLK